MLTPATELLCGRFRAKPEVPAFETVFEGKKLSVPRDGPMTGKLRVAYILHLSWEVVEDGLTKPDRLFAHSSPYV